MHKHSIILTLYLLIICGWANAQNQHKDGYFVINYDNFDGNCLQYSKYIHNPFWCCSFNSACLDLNPDNYIVKDGLLELKAFYTPMLCVPTKVVAIL